jgi:hypothetical protein
MLLVAGTHMRVAEDEPAEHAAPASAAAIWAPLRPFIAAEARLAKAAAPKHWTAGSAHSFASA